MVGCYYGLYAQRNAAGVGVATTRAVVTSIVGIIVLDAIFAICANALDI
jgi:ABC-type transporter Mla maintaining outer membrane lipid asymmetry permease subunit MlaE